MGIMPVAVFAPLSSSTWYFLSVTLVILPVSPWCVPPTTTTRSSVDSSVGVLSESVSSARSSGANSSADCTAALTKFSCSSLEREHLMHVTFCFLIDCGCRLPTLVKGEAAARFILVCVATRPFLVSVCFFFRGTIGIFS